MSAERSMLQLAIKVLVTSVLVVAISEAAKRSSLIGALLASLPLTSLLAFVWLYAETGDATKVASLATGIFWLVLPSLVLFFVTPWLIGRGLGFWPSLTLGIAATIVAYFAMVALLARWGIYL